MRDLDPETDPAGLEPTDVSSIGVDPTEEAPELWEAFAGDVEVTAEEYREDGWEVVELHPSAMEPIPESGDDDSDRVGFDLYVPDSELGRVKALLNDDFEPSEYEIYRAVADEFSFALVVEREAAEKRTVLVPLYYRTADAERTEALAREQGTVTIYLNALLTDHRVTFSHEDPDRFFSPPEEADDA